MRLTPDTWIFWQWGFFKLNATILFTWLIMATLTVGSWLVTRNLSTGPEVSRWQHMLEVIVGHIRDQIREILQDRADPYLYFLGTLFLFISLANLLAVVPVYEAPTGSLSTTAALATCVFFAVPIYGIKRRGISGYLKHYVRPSVILLPFQIISELSRTLALAVRLFGNIMSGSMIVAVLLTIVPFLVPIVMQLFGLLIGQIHAYIFAVLAAVYIASATRTVEQEEKEQTERQSNENSSEDTNNE